MLVTWTSNRSQHMMAPPSACFCWSFLVKSEFFRPTVAKCMLIGDHMIVVLLYVFSWQYKVPVSDCYFDLVEYVKYKSNFTKDESHVDLLPPFKLICQRVKPAAVTEFVTTH